MSEVVSGRLVIARDSEKDIKMRGLEVSLDGEFLVDLPFGKSVSRDLAGGDHVVRITNHLLSKTLTVPLADGEEVRLQVGNEFGLIGGFMMVVFGFGPYRVFMQEVARESGNPSIG